MRAPKKRLDHDAVRRGDALIERGAILDEGVEVAHFTYIGPHVYIGKNVRIGTHTCIEGNAEIHDGVRIGQNCTVDGVIIGTYARVAAGTHICLDTEILVLRGEARDFQRGKIPERSIVRYGYNQKSAFVGVIATLPAE